MKFANKIVVVTGGGSGIGRQTAARFGEEGATVVVVDIRGDAAEETARDIPGAVAVDLDVSDQRAVKEAFARLGEQHGKVDVLVNNAGVSAVGPASSMEESTWDRVLDTNLKSVYMMSQAAWPLLARDGGGCILNTSSTAGLWAIPRNIAFCASKAGVIMLTKCMALDGAREGIRVNCLCPGFVDTPNLQHFLESQEDPAAARGGAVALHPLGRLGEPGDIAEGFVFLASAEASWVTGAAVVIDGGLTLGLWRG